MLQHFFMLLEVSGANSSSMIGAGLGEHIAVYGGLTFRFSIVFAFLETLSASWMLTFFPLMTSIC